MNSILFVHVSASWQSLYQVSAGWQNLGNLSFGKASFILVNEKQKATLILGKCIIYVQTFLNKDVLLNKYDICMGECISSL